MNTNGIFIKGSPATNEQSDIIKCVAGGEKSVVINAFAGTGKTTTLIGVAEHAISSKVKILYLAFNASMAQSARTAFAHLPNVEVRTVHAFAKPHISSSDPTVRKNYTSSEISKLYGLSSKDSYVFLQEFEYFCNSDLLDFPSGMSHKMRLERFFEDMESGKVQMTHSFYLKKFHLNLVGSVPMKLQNYELAMLDEYQDTNAVTRAIFDNISAKQRIVVGDTHQNIYGFRGSSNIMNDMAGQKFYLTNSFRFGSEIANYASSFLHTFKGEGEKITGRGTSTVARIAVVLSRTNASLVQNILSFIKQGFYYKTIRDANLVFGLPLSIARLNAGGEVFSNEYKYLIWEKEKYQKEAKKYDNFASYFFAKGQERDDPEMMWSGKMAKEYTLDSLENAYEQTRVNNQNPEVCQYFAGTAHSAKGLEFDVVKMSDDFKNCFELVAKWAVANDITETDEGFLYSFVEHAREGNVPSDIIEEFNLFYVAITRAKVKVFFDNETANIFNLSSSEINSEINFYYKKILENMKKIKHFDKKVSQPTFVF